MEWQQIGFLAILALALHLFASPIRRYQAGDVFPAESAADDLMTLHGDPGIDLHAITRNGDTAVDLPSDRITAVGSDRVRER